MSKVVYDVRVVNREGKLVTKKRFKAKDQAFNFAQDKLVHQRRVKVARKEVAEAFRITPANEWGRSAHKPYQNGPRPVSTVFVHTSVTKQLPASATVEQEKAEMRSLDAIAKARGFNGVSYSICIFPSGRAYEGRGFGVVEAATSGYNTTSDSVCFVGNTDAHKPTQAQLDSMVKVLRHGQTNGYLAKNLTCRGHREVAAKACPGRYVTTAHLRSFEAQAA